MYLNLFLRHPGYDNAFVFTYLLYYISITDNYFNNLLITLTVMVAVSLAIGLVILHVYVPLSLVVTLSME